MNAAVIERSIRELLQRAAAEAEAAVIPWQRMRLLAFSGAKDAYGGAYVQLRFEDRHLRNAMKRIGAITKGVYSGTWSLEEPWRHVGQEAGLAIAMAEAACEVLRPALHGRATCTVHSYWS